MAEAFQKLQVPLAQLAVEQGPDVGHILLMPDLVHHPIDDLAGVRLNQVNKFPGNHSSPLTVSLIQITAVG